MKKKYFKKFVSKTIALVSLAMGIFNVSNAQICNGESVYAITSNGYIQKFTNPNTSGSLLPAINTTPVVPIAAVPGNANCLAYNKVNGKFYFMRPNLGTKELYSYDPVTDTYQLLSSAGQVPGVVQNRATISPDGTKYYVIDGSGSRFSYFDIPSGAWVPLATTWRDQYGNSLTAIIRSEESGDIAMDGEGNLWLLTSPSGMAGSVGSLKVYKIAASAIPTSSQPTPVTVTLMAENANFAGGTADGIAFSSTGEIYISSSGGVLTKLNNDYSLTTIGTYSGALGTITDLTSCATPNTSETTDMDFGDAPDSYSTTLSANGARHLASYYDVANDTSRLMLGAKYDVELDGAPTANALGDNNAGVNDEDGVAVFTPLTGSNITVTNYSVAVSVHNTTGTTANLVAWIDWNGNGVFDASEGVVKTVPNGISIVNVVWPSALLVTKATDTGVFARFRLTTDAITTSNTGGIASDGEVEDYLIPLNNPGNALSATITNLLAKIVNGQLLVNFTTLGENDNRYFEVQASKDGKNFTTIGKVNSKAVNGNATEALNYDFSTNAATALTLGLGMLLLGGSCVLSNRKHRMVLSAITALTFATILISCSKQSDVVAGNDRLYIRIAQVDKDGTKTYSKIIKAGKE